jgi:hypothetical protein
MTNIFKVIFKFYYDWFKNLTSTSRKLWLLMFVKTAIIMTVLMLFFPNILWKYSTDEEKANVVWNNLLNISK